MLQHLFASPARLRRALNVAGFVILLGGASSAAWTWRAAGADDAQAAERLDNPTLPLAPSDSGKQSREIEIYYGPMGLLFERWSETYSHGKPLARLILVSSSILALGCFLAAARMCGPLRQKSV